MAKLKYKKKKRIQEVKSGSGHPGGKDRTEKDKTHLEFHLLRNKKGLNRYMSSKRKTSENVVLLLNGAKGLLRKDMENLRHSVSSLLQSLLVKIMLQESEGPETSRKSLE